MQALLDLSFFVQIDFLILEYNPEIYCILNKYAVIASFSIFYSWTKALSNYTWLKIFQATINISNFDNYWVWNHISPIILLSKSYQRLVKIFLIIRVRSNDTHATRFSLEDRHHIQEIFCWSWIGGMVRVTPCSQKQLL